MNEYLQALVFICFGLLGQYLHFLKKRYVDQTINCSLYDYALCERQRTFAAITSTVMTEIALSQSSPILGLSVFVGAITAGYTVDSGLNKGPTK